MPARWEACLDGDRADVGVGIHVEQGVLVEVARSGDGHIAKLNVQGVCFCAVANLHSLNPRSKNVL
jgi:hypothetical protein